MGDLQLVEFTSFDFRKFDCKLILQSLFILLKIKMDKNSN